MTVKAMEPLTQDLINEVSTLKQRIGQAKEENENLWTKIQSSKHAPVSTSKKSQTSDQCPEKGRLDLISAKNNCRKENVEAHKWQQLLEEGQRKVAVKDDILLPLKSQKYAWANDKTCERKNLLTLLQMGLNVVEMGKHEAKIEFVVDSRRILTNYCCVEEKFSLISIEPPVDNQVLQSMQELLEETNDICGLLSAAKANP